MVASTLDRDAVEQMLLFMADRIIAAEPVLSEADRHLGDGERPAAVGFEVASDPSL